MSTVYGVLEVKKMTEFVVGILPQLRLHHRRLVFERVERDIWEGDGEKEEAEERESVVPSPKAGTTNST